MEEVSLTIDEAKLKKMADEMLRQRCTSGDEHQYHIDQMKNFLKSDIVWESRKEILVSPHPQKTTQLVHSCQRDPEAPASEHNLSTEIIARTELRCIVSITEPDYKNLNKKGKKKEGIIEDIYLLIMNGKVPDYADTGLLWSLSVFIRILNEAFVRPLNLEGELYIGIPPGVESRLATLTIDKNDLITLGQLAEAYRLDPASTATPSSFTHNTIETLIPLCNTLNARRAIHLAANGHFSARAVARYYAALMDPTFPSKKIFTSSKAKLHDAFLGSGDYKDLILQNGMFGLRFKRVEATDGEIIRFICSELDLPVPQDYAESRDFIEEPKIN
ncbi:hypothetical protein Tco_1143221 [Tanacetum coccineum]